MLSKTIAGGGPHVLPQAQYNNMKKLKFVIISLFSILLVVPTTSFAIGQITSPIIISDALRGRSYDEELTIINTEKATTTINLSAEGAIKDWTTFFEPNNLDIATSSIFVPAAKTIKMIARFNIPESASLGEHIGMVSVGQSAASKPDATESSASLTQKIDRQVLIKINTQEKISYNVSIIPENYDIALNQNLKIRIIYDNLGNSDIKPDIHLQIKNGDNIKYNILLPYPDNELAVKPNSQHEIRFLEIPLTGFDKGKYEASFDFYDNDKLTQQKDFYFNIREEAEIKTLMGSLIDTAKKQGPLLLVGVGIVILGVFMSRLMIIRRKKYQRILKFHDIISK